MVAVHDAARPLVTAELLDRCVSQLERWGCDGVVAAARAVDTIKEADAGGRVLATLERSRLWAVQTPQAFRARPLARALADGDLDRAYDDAQLVEEAGGDVRIVEAPRQNFKSPPRTTCGRRSAPRMTRQLLTDYHTHLRPDVGDTPPERYFTEANVRRYLDGRGRARRHRARLLRARVPLPGGARHLAAPVLGGVRA